MALSSSVYGYQKTFSMVIALLLPTWAFFSYSWWHPFISFCLFYISRYRKPTPFVERDIFIWEMFLTSFPHATCTLTRDEKFFFIHHERRIIIIMSHKFQKSELVAIMRQVNLSCHQTDMQVSNKNLPSVTKNISCMAFFNIV